MYDLIVLRRNHCHIYTFDTVSKAYHFYLRYYSTIGDWFYYLIHAHKFLHTVKDEKCMEAIFRNVFKLAYLSEN